MIKNKLKLGLKKSMNKIYYTNKYIYKISKFINNK